MKDFEEFVKKGIAKKQSPDKSRANFLIEESKISMEGLNERIEKIGIKKNQSNSIIKDCHDIILELIRAKMIAQGYNALGQGAHEAEVSYMKNLGFEEKDIQFVDKLRYFRNGMVYYGKVLDEEYAKKVLNFLNKIYVKLIK